MIEVFRTDVICPIKASEIVDAIKSRIAEIEADFDLEDCDHVFRISTKNNSIDLPILVMQQFEIMGHFAVPLDDKPLQIFSSKIFSPIYRTRGINVFLSFI